MEKTLTSGAVITLNTPPWKDAYRLYTEVVRELEAVKVEFGETNFGSLDQLMEMKVDDKAINTLKNVVCRLMVSNGVQSALQECMKRCLYNGRKITDEVFEPEASRSDFLIVEKEVLWHSLHPFLKDLSSLFSQFQANRKISDQK